MIAYRTLVQIFITVKDTVQAIKSLQNPKAPLVRKRQLMRLKCGDYRAKMEAENKQFKLGKIISTIFSVS